MACALALLPDLVQFHNSGEFRRENVEKLGILEIVKFVQPFVRPTKILPPREKLILNTCPN